MASWRVRFAPEFEPEFAEFEQTVQDELLAQAKVVEQFGPQAGRPRVDTLNGSKHANMKELRFDAHLARLRAQEQVVAKAGKPGKVARKRR